MHGSWFLHDLQSLPLLALIPTHWHNPFYNNGDKITCFPFSPLSLHTITEENTKRLPILWGNGLWYVLNCSSGKRREGGRWISKQVKWSKMKPTQDRFNPTFQQLPWLIIFLQTAPVECQQMDEILWEFLRRWCCKTLVNILVLALIFSLLKSLGFF